MLASAAAAGLFEQQAQHYRRAAAAVAGTAIDEVRADMEHACSTYACCTAVAHCISHV